jgi:acetyl/propionyl-CoA carboxylase alpha subunit
MKKIKKVLIANRGEVALRITRTLKELDIAAIAIYEKSDSDAYYLRFADKAVMIGNHPVKDYLDTEKIIRAAREQNVDAIHPGYGFLSESFEFAEACEKAGIIFIGPPSHVIRNLGNKVIAREIAARADIAIIQARKACHPENPGWMRSPHSRINTVIPLCSRRRPAAGAGVSGNCGTMPI